MPLSDGHMPQADVARQVLALAGLDDRVEVVAGLSSEVLPRLTASLPAGEGRRAGLVFLVSA